MEGITIGYTSLWRPVLQDDPDIVQKVSAAGKNKPKTLANEKSTLPELRGRNSLEVDADSTYSSADERDCNIKGVKGAKEYFDNEPKYLIRDMEQWKDNRARRVFENESLIRWKVKSRRSIATEPLAKVQEMPQLRDETERRDPTESLAQFRETTRLWETRDPRDAAKSLSKEMKYLLDEKGRRGAKAKGLIRLESATNHVGAFTGSLQAPNSSMGTLSYTYGNWVKPYVNF
jgi:hypothetical protein